MMAGERAGSTDSIRRMDEHPLVASAPPPSSRMKTRAEVEWEICRLYHMAPLHKLRAVRTLADAMLWVLGERDRPVSDRLLPVVRDDDAYIPRDPKGDV
jgi:hypothetical protein